MENLQELYYKLLTPYVDSGALEEIAIGRGFFRAPASASYHGNIEGGLLQHSYAMTRHLQYLTDSLGLKWQNKRSPVIIGMFHDLCKVDNYRWNETKKKFEYRKDTMLKGHGDKSVMMLSQYLRLTEEEIMCIRYHMGAFSTNPEDWKDYTRAVSWYPNVLWTHTADMLAAHVNGV